MFSFEKDEQTRFTAPTILLPILMRHGPELTSIGCIRTTLLFLTGLESRLRLRFEMKTHSTDKSKTKPTFALFKMWRAISLYLILPALT